MQVWNKGWTTSAVELVAVRLLDRMGEAERQGGSVNLEHIDGMHTDATLLQDAAHLLMEHGLAGDDESPSSDSPGRPLQSTPAGHRAWRQVRERRVDVAARNQGCMEALLWWLYDEDSRGVPRPEITEFSGTTMSNFYGRPFSEEEITRAAQRLREENFITGNADWDGTLTRPLITEQGKRFVEEGAQPLSPGMPTITVPGVVSGAHIPSDPDTGRPDLNSDDLEELREHLDELTFVLATAAPEERELVGWVVDDIEEEVASGLLRPGMLQRLRDRLHTLGEYVQDRNVRARIKAVTAALAALIRS